MVVLSISFLFNNHACYERYSIFYVVAVREVRFMKMRFTKIEFLDEEHETIFDTIFYDFG